jgi:hypothetical protein
MTHFDSHLLPTRLEDQAVFGKFSTLDFDAQLLAKQTKQVGVVFKLKQMQIYTNINFVASRMAIWKKDYKSETMTKFDGGLFAGRLRN